MTFQSLRNLYFIEKMKDQLFRLTLPSFRSNRCFGSTSFQALVKNLNYKLLNIDQQNIEANVLHPGLSYTDYGINGQPKVWSVMKAFESARLFAHHVKDDNGDIFRHYEKLTRDRFMFIVTSEVVLHKALYDYSVPKIPLIACVKGGHVGKTSLSHLTELKTQDGRHILAENLNHLVSVGKDTRRPLELPEWWRNKFESKTGPLVLKKYDVPENSASYEEVVKWSETDLNYHANWTMYARMAIDAMHHNNNGDMLKHTESNLRNNLSKMQFYFFGESLLKDLVSVRLWEDDNCNSIVYSEFSKHILKDGAKFIEPICQCKLFFN